MRFRLVVFVTVFCFLLGTAVIGHELASGVQGVSPGSSDRTTAIGGGCPTFSWQGLLQAESYELVIYQLHHDLVDFDTADLSPENEVLFTRVRGGATSWTPELADCLLAGGKFVWFIRAVTDAETVESSEWSEPRFFEVAAAPSAEDLERAIEIIRRWEAAAGDGPLALSADAVSASASDPATATAAVTDSGTGSGSGSSHPKSVVTGTAAIRGVQPDASGETYGVVGTSASPDGAGIGAANTAGGPDLVLDGAVPAEFTEAGVDRSSASAQTFSFTNTSGGGMTLDIDGVDVVTTATDQDTIGSLTCGSGQLAKWNGATWVCAPDLDTDTLSGLSCATWQIPKWNGSIWECNTDWDTLYGLGCGPGQIAKYIDGTASWECAEDRDTTYSLGPGLILDGDQIRIDPAEFAVQTTTVAGVTTIDSAHLALTIGSDGLGLIAFFDSAAQQLRVAHCEDPLCATATISAPETLAGAGRYPSITTGSDGLGVISYWAGASVDNLRVAHCDDLACTSATITGLSAQCGRHSSITIGPDGHPLISYHSSYNGLEVAHCLNHDCSSLDFGLPLAIPVQADDTYLSIGSDGFGVILYYEEDFDEGRYWIVHCENPSCSAASENLIFQANDMILFDPEGTVAISDDGLPFIALLDTEFRVTRLVQCDDAACTSSTLLKILDGRKLLDLVYGSNRRPLVATISSLDLKIHRCSDQICAHLTEVFIDDLQNNPNVNLAVAKGPGGRILIAWVDGSALKVTRLPVGF